MSIVAIYYNIIKKIQPFSNGYELLKTDVTGGTKTELLTTNEERLVMPNNSVWNVKIQAVAIRTDSTGEYNSWNIDAMITRTNDASSTTLVYSDKITQQSNNNWILEIEIDTTNGAPILNFTGESGKEVSVRSEWYITK